MEDEEEATAEEADSSTAALAKLVCLVWLGPGRSKWLTRSINSSAVEWGGTMCVHGMAQAIGLEVSSLWAANKRSLCVKPWLMKKLEINNVLACAREKLILDRGVH